jgi:hypothetical protein
MNEPVEPVEPVVEEELIERVLADELGKYGEGGRIASPHLASHRFDTVVDVSADSIAAPVAFSDAIARLRRPLDPVDGGG